MSYTTQQKIADFLQIDVSNIPVDYLALADAMVETVLNRKFNETTITDELYDGTDTDELVIENYPITELTKVEFEDLNRIWHEFDLGNFALYKKEGILKMKLLPNTEWFTFDPLDAVFSCGSQIWRLNYKYGYTTVPKVVELLATLYGITFYQQQVGVTNGTISSEKIGDYSIGYDNSSTGKDLSVVDLIDEIVLKIKKGVLDIRAV